jgi:hypothetical protein
MEPDRARRRPTERVRVDRASISVSTPNGSRRPRQVPHAPSTGRAAGFLEPGAEPTGDDLVAVEDFLTTPASLPVHLEGRMTDRQRIGQDLAGDALRSSRLAHPEERLRPSSPLRNESARNPLSGYRRRRSRGISNRSRRLEWAISREDVPIDRSPWVVVRPRRKVKGKSTWRRDGPDWRSMPTWCSAYLSPGAGRNMRHRGGLGSGSSNASCWSWRCAGCGPGRPPACARGHRTASRRRAGVAGRSAQSPTHPGERWLDADEDPEWGPLKDRDLTESRRVPIPSPLATKLRRHLELYGNGPGGLVFHRNDKAFDRDMFARNVWEPARAKLFPRRPISLLTILANPNSHACAATTCATLRARGGCAKASTLSSVNVGRGTEHSRCSSTSTRASPRVARTKASNGSSEALRVPRSCAPLTAKVTARVAPTTLHTSPV